MAFQQLYFTSCQQGLSGFPGYQFNAVTPGVAPEVMRAVEALTAYEPPRSLGYRPTDDEIAACPVNLCFTPGNSAIIANVVFVGADFSQRFGNYFAHAIVTSDPDADLGSMLPVELWQAPFWVRDVAPTVELAALPGPPPTGPIDRAGVQAFVDGHRSASRLPALLSAADRAMTTGDRSVVVVESDAGAAAHWIAALSYLLPPAQARRMSFTTYHHRPSYCPLHVIGTVPDADIELDGAGFDSFHLFDLVSDRASDLGVHPLAGLLARVGPAAAARFWEQVSALSAGAAESLDDWYPAATASAALQGIRLERRDLDVAVEWLAAGRGRLGPERTAMVGGALLDQAELADQHLSGLAVAATAAGAMDLLEDVERRLVDAELSSLLEVGGRPPGASPARITSTAGRAHATRRCEQQLDGADAATTVALLGWATASGVDLGGPALVATGERVIGPLLLRTPPDDTVRRLMVDWPALLQGVTSHLASVAAGRPDEVSASLDKGIADLLGERDVVGHPRLHELQLVSVARRQPVGRARALARVLTARKQDGAGADGADRALLQRLWPEGAWSIDEARQVLEVLDPGEVQAGAVPEWLTAVLTRPVRPDDEKSLDDYLLLCRRLDAHPVGRRLPEPGDRLLKWGVYVDGELQKAASKSGGEVVEIVRELAGQLDGVPPALRLVLLGELPRLLLRMPPTVLGDVLAECPEPVFEAYLAQIRPQLEPGRADPGLGARMFLVMLELEGAEHPYGRVLGEELLATLPEWRKRDLEMLAVALERADPNAVPLFEQWRERYHKRFHGRLGQLLHRRQRRNSTG